MVPPAARSAEASAAAVAADVARHLPPPPARLLTLGLEPRACAALGAAGWAVENAAAPAAADERRGYDALVCGAGGKVERRLEALRAQLAEGGTLLLVARPDASLRETVCALLEAGFTIDAEEAGAVGHATRLVAARRDPYRVRSYRPGDEAAILELFHASFHHRRSLAEWRWKYRDSPYGAGKISLALASDGALAAHYAGYPVPFRRQDGATGRTLRALQVGDTMTAAAVRHVGRGRTSLLARTVRHFYAAHCDGRVAFNYGFNEGKIQRFSRRFAGAGYLEPVGFWVRPTATPEGASTGRYRVTAVTRPGREWDRFFERVAPAYGFLVERRRRYLAWRYPQAAGGYVILAAHRSGLAAWGVWRKIGEALVWGDALFDPREVDAAGDLLAAAGRFPGLAGATRIEAWFPERPSWWAEALRRLGFERRPEPQDLGLVYVPHVEQRAGELLRRLYYTKGDGDLF